MAMNRMRQVCIGVATALLVACGGGSNNETPTTGVAVDFYLSGSTVSFANADCAPTITDARGRFMIPRSDCGRITVSGGTDVATNLPLAGSFTAPAGATVVSPVTTLIQSLVEAGRPLSQAQSTVMDALGLTRDPTQTDPLTDPDALASTVALAQVAQQTADVLTQTGGLTSAGYRNVYLTVLRNVAINLPAESNTGFALDAAFIAEVAVDIAATLAPGSVAAQNAVLAAAPTIANIAVTAAAQIVNARAALSAAADGDEALAIATSTFNIGDHLRTLSNLSQTVTAELRQHDLNSISPSTLANRVRSAVSAGAPVPILGLSSALTSADTPPTGTQTTAHAEGSAPAVSR